MAKRLAGYSLAAGAALAGAEHAQADIIYSGPLGPQHGFGEIYGPCRLQMEGDIPEAYLNGGTTTVDGGMGGSLHGTGLWVNRHADNFQVATLPVGGTTAGGMSAGTTTPVVVASGPTVRANDTMGGGGTDPGDPTGRIIAAQPGQLIGQAQTVTNTTMNGATTTQQVGASVVPNQSSGAFTGDGYGFWTADGSSAYMGFSFDLESDGSTVFGWAEIVRIDAKNGRLLGWAYEDSGESIRAGAIIPEPSSLALLALGAAGIAPWRRRKKA